MKKGQKAIFRIPYIGREPIKIQWYLEGEELKDETNIKIEHSEGYSRLLLNKLQRKDSGEIKIKLRNDFGTVEALSKLVVLGMYKKNMLKTKNYKHFLIQNFTFTYTISCKVFCCISDIEFSKD